MEEKVLYSAPDAIVSHREEDIAYLKECQRLLSAQNFLVGEFGDDGSYKINEELCKELTNMDKVIDEKETDIYYATGIVGGEKLKFRVYLESRGEKKLATLKLLEQIKLDENFDLETQIATFLDDDDNAFYYRMKDAFRLFTKEEAEGRSMDESSKCPKLSAIFKDHKQTQNTLSYGRDNLDKQYIKSVLKVLKENESVTPLVKDFLLLVRKYPKKYPLLRRSLDRLISNAIKDNLLKEPQLKKIDKLRKTYLVIAVKNEEEYKILNKVPEEKKVKKKSPQAKNGKVKSGGKSASKKPSAPAKKQQKATYFSSPRPVAQRQAKPQVAPQRAVSPNRATSAPHRESAEPATNFGYFDLLK